MEQIPVKKKKILHTTTRFVSGGGVEKNIYYTIKTLYTEFDFHISCGPDFKNDLFEAHPEVNIIICPYLINKISPLKDFKALWFYYRLIRREKYDVVHTHETKASFITKLAAWLACCPFIIYGLHGVTFNDPMSSIKRRFYILLEKLTIRCADIIVAVGYETIEAYHKENIGKKIPFEVVRSGIDIDTYLRESIQNEDAKLSFRNTMNIGPEDVVMITVGRFSYSKAQRYAIQAFAILQKKYNNLKLLLVGEGELLEECKTLADKLNIPVQSIYFLGYQEHIPKYLSVSDIFIFTSLREGLPRVIVEASLLKVAVVTFKVEGAAEVLENEKTGFIVQQADIDELILKTEQLILHPSLRTSFGNAAYAHVIKQWDMRIMGQKLHNIYNRNKG